MQIQLFQEGLSNLTGHESRRILTQRGNEELLGLLPRILQHATITRGTIDLRRPSVGYNGEPFPDINRNVDYLRVKLSQPYQKDEFHQSRIRGEVCSTTHNGEIINVDDVNVLPIGSLFPDEMVPLIQPIALSDVFNALAGSNIRRLTYTAPPEDFEPGEFKYIERTSNHSIPLTRAGVFVPTHQYWEMFGGKGH